jgi:hypothetical protein
MMDREQIEIGLGIAAAVLLVVSEALALSKKSDCNSIAEFLASAAQFIRTQIRREGNPPQNHPSPEEYTP